MSLRGVEALPSPLAGENDPPEWQELAPELAKRPVQVDLLARAADSCDVSSLGDVTIPQGVYNQIRLQLVPNQPKANEPVPEESACGRAGYNCVVAGDDAARELVWGEAPEMRVPAERIEGGFFRVLPGGDIHLAVEFDPRSSMAVPAGNAVRLLAAFSASASPQPWCESRGQ